MQNRFIYYLLLAPCTMNITTETIEIIYFLALDRDRLNDLMGSPNNLLINKILLYKTVQYQSH